MMMCEWMPSPLRGYRTSCGYTIFRYKGKPIEEQIEKLHTCVKCGNRIKTIPHPQFGKIP